MASQPSYKFYEQYVDAVTPAIPPRDAGSYLRLSSRLKIRVVDISSTGQLEDLELAFSLQACRGTRYEDFIEAERQALRTELKDIKTRLVLSRRLTGDVDLSTIFMGLNFKSSRHSSPPVVPSGKTIILHCSWKKIRLNS